MKISGYKERVLGMNVKNDNFYVIRNKETYEFVDEHCDQVLDILDAEWFRSYRDAKDEVNTFDEPQLFDVILVSCLIRLEEIM